MLFRSNTKINGQKIGTGWRESFFIHGTLIGVFFLLWLKPSFNKKNVEMVIVENPKVSEQQKITEIQKPPPKPKTPQKRAVFGLSKKTMLAETSDSKAPEIKAGNTVAKEQDQLKMRPEDDEALPVPADEVFVSKMPKVKTEIQIPFPPDAKSKGIQGGVIMDLLIDSEGRVREAKLIEGPSPLLNEAALQGIKSFVFEPAEMQGQKVAVRIRYIYRFVLER